MTNFYDYNEAVKADIYDYITTIDNQVDYETLKYNREQERDRLYDEMFTSDSVTGNGSGSYTFDRQTAHDYLNNNFDLLAEALEAFDPSNAPYTIRQGAEACDVTIRCYLLGVHIDDVIDTILEECEKEEE